MSLNLFLCPQPVRGADLGARGSVVRVQVVYPVLLHSVPRAKHTSDGSCGGVALTGIWLSLPRLWVKHSQHCRTWTELAAATRPPKEFGTVSLLGADTSVVNKWIPKTNRQGNDSGLEHTGSTVRQQDFHLQTGTFLAPNTPHCRIPLESWWALNKSPRLSHKDWYHH